MWQLVSERHNFGFVSAGVLGKIVVCDGYAVEWFAVCKIHKWVGPHKDMVL